MNKKAKDLLYSLMTQLTNSEVEIKEFCSKFESTFNFDVDKKDLTNKEFEEFSKVFKEVVYFSSYKEDHKVYPGYTDDKKIREIVNSVLSALK